MELLFEGKKELLLDLALAAPTIQDLLGYMRDRVLKERPELFMQGNTMYSAAPGRPRAEITVVGRAS